MSISSTIKRKVIAPILYQSGWARRNIWRQKGGVILNYHGVLPEPFARINNRHVSTTQFARDLEYYRKHFRILSLREAFHQDLVSNDPRPWLAVTFDDGFVNNLRYALPILTKFDVPATIFVLSATIKNEHFVNWADLIDVLARRTESKKIRFLNKVYHVKSGHFVSSENENQTLVETIKNAGPERCSDLNELMNVLWSDNELIRRYGEHFKLMNLKELRECCSSPLIEIGSHSKMHYNLGRMSDTVAHLDILESKTEIEAALQTPIESLAYPDGDYSARTKDIAESIGYIRQLAVTYRLQEDQGDKRILRRFSYSNSTTHESNMVRLGMQWAANNIG